MGRKMLDKLRSRKGASLTFALLAFLVCAVVGAVLLASASAAAGRLSGLAESDQRYYAVTSAAQLFCDALDGQSFTIEQTSTKNQRVTSYYEYKEEGFRKTGDTKGEIPGKDPYTYKLRLKAPYDITDPTKTYAGEDLQSVGDGVLLKGNSLLTEAALYYVFGDTSRTAEAVLAGTFVSKTFGSGHSHSVYPTWNLTLEVGDIDCLEVAVEGKMSENGDVELKFQNQTSGDDADAFSMIIVLHADVRESQVTLPERNVGSGSTPPNLELKYESWVDTAQDTVNTTVITWRVAEVKKVAA